MEADPLTLDVLLGGANLMYPCGCWGSASPWKSLPTFNRAMCDAMKCCAGVGLGSTAFERVARIPYPAEKNEAGELLAQLYPASVSVCSDTLEKRQ